MHLQKVIDFLLPSPDVLQFYAAADLYAGPSMEDSFGLPIAEAMACGLPVIASVNAGASELIRHGENGMLLQKCTDAQELASLIRTIVSEPVLRERLALLAASTIRATCSWDQNAAETREFLENALRSKKERRD
jgi:glycosyltransferase involved in cell wall biosynthesis